MNDEPITPDTRKERMWQLHAALLKCFLDTLDSPGELKASFLAAAAKFLADNGITAKNMGRKSLQDGVSELDNDMSLPFKFDS